MLNLLGFFEGENASGNQNPTGSYIMLALLGVILVVFVVMSVISSRKRKKSAEEMAAKLGLGAIVTTIGGIVGEVVQMDDKYIWLLTGVEGDKTTMQFLRQAVHSIDLPSDPNEAKAEMKAAEKEGEELDEIK